MTVHRRSLAPSNLALATFLAGIAARPARHSLWICASPPVGAAAGLIPCSRSASGADIEIFARDLEESASVGAAPTVTRRLCTDAELYRCAVVGELLDPSPAAHVRRPARRRVAHDQAGPQSGCRTWLPPSSDRPGEHALSSFDRP